MLHIDLRYSYSIYCITQIIHASTELLTIHSHDCLLQSQGSCIKEEFSMTRDSLIDSSLEIIHTYANRLALYIIAHLRRFTVYDAVDVFAEEFVEFLYW